MYNRDDTEWDALANAGLSYLIDLARSDSWTTYSNFNRALVESTGTRPFNFELAADRAAMGHLLGLIVKANFAETGFMITALVHYINQDDAGSGFFKLAVDLGLLQPGADVTTRFEFWVGQVAKAHAFYGPGVRR